MINLCNCDQVWAPIYYVPCLCHHPIQILSEIAIQVAYRETLFLAMKKKVGARVLSANKSFQGHTQGPPYGRLGQRKDLNAFSNLVGP
jgi:hypothetical protein